MADKDKLKVGMTVWIKKNYSGKGLAKRIIDKIGRKYFYTNCHEKVIIESLCVIDKEMGVCGKAYLSSKEYEDEYNKDLIIQNIRAKYNRLYSLPLAKLEEINKMINKEEI